MSRASLAVCTLLLFVSTSLAITPTTNASLKGAYSFYVSGGQTHGWGAQLTCSGQSIFMGGTDTRENAVVGNMTFNGTGGVTGTFTQYGQFNQSASNATVSCTSNGHAVYNAGVNGTFTGTYSIQSNGTGAMSITASTPGSVGGFILKLAGQCASTGVSNTVFLTILKSDNAVDSTGMARLQ